MNTKQAGVIEIKVQTATRLLTVAGCLSLIFLTTPATAFIDKSYSSKQALGSSPLYIRAMKPWEVKGAGEHSLPGTIEEIFKNTWKGTGYCMLTMCEYQNGTRSTE
jgi:hypothetical protein